MNWKTTLLTCLGILLVGGIVTFLIFSTEPAAERTGASRETAMLVDVTTVRRDTVQPRIQAMGTVEPSQDIVLSPRVSGRVLRRAASFTPGGYVEEGDTLLQIDPSDYENTLQQRKSELRQATSDLKLETWRHEIAEREYSLRSDTLTAENRSFAVREPQLDAAQSQVASARAAVEQAELALRRTTITAPFDAHVLGRNVNLGSQVAPGDNLGRLVGRDTYWIEVTVPMDKLRWLRQPSEDDPGAPVRVRNRSAWPEGTYREGELFRVVGALEEQTRMARVLVEVPDPRADQPTHAGRPALMIGAYVETQIQGETLENVFRLHRDYLRDGDTVWVMENGTLRIRDATIVFRDETYAYVREGLRDGDQVVTTNLSTVSDGAPLRLEGTETDSLPDPVQ